MQLTNYKTDVGKQKVRIRTEISGLLRRLETLRVKLGNNHILTSHKHEVLVTPLFAKHVAENGGIRPEPKQVESISSCKTTLCTLRDTVLPAAVTGEDFDAMKRDIKKIRGRVEGAEKANNISRAKPVMMESIMV